MTKDGSRGNRDVGDVRRRARLRLMKEVPEIVSLLTQARSRLAVSSRGLSELIEALAQHLACVRTKVSRVQAAPEHDMDALLIELEREWSALDVCAARIQASLSNDPMSAERHGRVAEDRRPGNALRSSLGKPPPDRGSLPG
jgi:hypothetical protein